MIKVLLILMALLALAVCALVLAVRIQRKSLNKARSDLLHYRIQLDEVREDAECLQTALKAQVNVEDKANAEKQNLSKTADSDLIHRANNLF
jgi:type II secretory pathway pseudopilin PulG